MAMAMNENQDPISPIMVEKAKDPETEIKNEIDDISSDPEVVLSDVEKNYSVRFEFYSTDLGMIILAKISLCDNNCEEIENNFGVVIANLNDPSNGFYCEILRELSQLFEKINEIIDDGNLCFTNFSSNSLHEFIGFFLDDASSFGDSLDDYDFQYFSNRYKREGSMGDLNRRIILEIFNATISYGILDPDFFISLVDDIQALMDFINSSYSQ